MIFSRTSVCRNCVTVVADEFWNDEGEDEKVQIIKTRALHLVFLGNHIGIIVDRSSIRAPAELF